MPDSDPNPDRVHRQPDVRRVARVRAGGRVGWRTLAALAGALAVVLVPLTYRIAWAESIFPGVHVAGIHVGGMTPTAARDTLIDHELDPAARVEVRAAGRSWTLPREALGLDMEATVQRAYAVGRRGHRPGQLLEMTRLRMSPRSLPPVLRFDEAAVRREVKAIAAEVERAPVDADVRLDGLEVAVTDPVTGRQLLVEPAMTLLREVAARGTWPVQTVDLPSEEQAPAVRDARAAATKLRTLLAGPVELRAFNERWTFTPQELAPLLLPRPSGETMHVEMARDGFGKLLGRVTDTVSRTAEAPRFHFDPESGRLEVSRAAVTGRKVDVQRTMERLLALEPDQPRRVHVAVDFVQPEIGEDVTAQELGIRELVHEETSYYRGSSADRVHNIAVAADKFDGILVAPDEVFSFNETIGDISEDTGYRKTLIILDGATADGVGGGVCQVSTTLFRSAFWTGLPIVERLAHGYRVGYYEQNSPTGLDATVYGPIVDLKFRNDTDSWLLLETEADSANHTLTFRMYGTKPQRSVSMDGPVVHNRTPPPEPEVVLDPELAPGQQRVEELEREGLSVTVTRLVEEADGERRDQFHSTYRPTGALTLVGPTPQQPAAPVEPPPGTP